MDLRVVVSLACVALAVGSPARADVPVAPAAKVRQPSIVDYDFGFLTGHYMPAGDFGAEMQVGITRWFAIAADGGLDFFDGPQFALMPRVRVPIGSHSIYAGVGGAWGHFQSPRVPCLAGLCPTLHADGDAQYVTGEIGDEKVIDHVFVRGFIGGKAVTNIDELCPGGGCDPYYLYGGVALGMRL